MGERSKGRLEIVTMTGLAYTGAFEGITARALRAADKRE